MTLEMRYYLAKLSFHDHASRMRYANSVCLAATDDLQAKELLGAVLGNREGLKGERQRDGGYFYDVDAKGFTVYAETLHEVPATAAETLAQILPGAGDFTQALLMAENIPREVSLRL